MTLKSHYNCYHYCRDDDDDDDDDDGGEQLLVRPFAAVVS